MSDNSDRVSVTDFDLDQRNNVDADGIYAEQITARRALLVARQDRDALARDRDELARANFDLIKRVEGLEVQSSDAAYNANYQYKMPINMVQPMPLDAKLQNMESKIHHNSMLQQELIAKQSIAENKQEERWDRFQEKMLNFMSEQRTQISNLSSPIPRPVFSSTPLQPIDSTVLQTPANTMSANNRTQLDTPQTQGASPPGATSLTDTPTVSSNNTSAPVTDVIPKTSDDNKRYPKLPYATFDGTTSLKDFLVCFERHPSFDVWNERIKGSALMGALKGQARDVIGLIDQAKIADFSQVVATLSKY